MQVQRRPTTKDLDDAQVGYEKKYADARAGALVGFASEGNFPFVGFPHACNLVFVGFALHRNSPFVDFAFVLVFARAVISRICLIFPVHAFSSKSLVHHIQATCILLVLFILTLVSLLLCL